MAGFFHLPGWAFSLARRVLYLWVRTTVLPRHPQSLGLDPSKSVCYVLQNQHLSDLLVLSQESERAGLPLAGVPIRLNTHHFPHAVFFLSRRGFNTTARERYAHSLQMIALLREARSEKGQDVQIVPVVILWGRRPNKQKSILKALFSETWYSPGSLRRLLTIFLHGRNVLVRFSAPVSLRALSHERFDEAQALRKLSRVLRVHFRHQRQMAIGPDLSHRHTQIENLLATQSVRSAIAAEAHKQGISFVEAQRRARCYALEIASDYSYGTLRAFELFLSWLWDRLYDGIEIHNMDSVTRMARNQGIVYVPTHRSHVDYLLLSYVLHRHGLTPPHIAAGANLNIPILGTLLRRCGAFFLRRSFKGQPLYAAVFHEYLHCILMQGFPLEYFIEGGRSRSGRTLTPKAGILGMTVRSFIREHSRPLVFVPVYIGYEKIIEGPTFIREQSGKPKQGESLWGILQSIQHIKRVFGKVHINFGRPLVLADFLETYRPGWAPNTSDAPDDWSRAATQGAALELAKRLNEAAVITPVNLIALALLSTPKNTADGQALNRLLEHYQALVSGAPYSAETVPCTLDSREIVAYAERLGFAERITHPMGDLIQAPKENAALLTYFRNNVLHLFALPSLIACLVSHNHGIGRERMNGAIAEIYNLLGVELFLHWTSKELPVPTQAIIEVFSERGLLRRNDAGELSAPEPNSQAFAELRWIGEILRPILERHFLMLSLLRNRGPGCQTRHALENDCHLLTQRLALLYGSGTPDYSEKTTFSALVTQLIDAELLCEDETGLLHFDQRITTPLAYTELVLPIETRQAIQRLTCTKHSS